MQAELRLDEIARAPGREREGGLLEGRHHLPADEARALDPVQVHAIARTVLASLWMLGDAAERPAIDQPIPRTVPRY